MAGPQCVHYSEEVPLRAMIVSLPLMVVAESLAPGRVLSARGGVCTERTEAVSQSSHC